jgi:hypothetical protein
MNAAERAIALCESLATRDVQNRNIGPLAAHTRGMLLSAARSIADHPSPRIGIITGFFLLHAAPPNCETDGPPGAAMLAAGLTAAGIPCRIATDVDSAEVVRTAVAGARLEQAVPVDVVTTPERGGRGHSIEIVRQLWEADEHAISHVISIERCGPSPDGRPRDARGVDISARNAPLERLYSGDWITIGIGDLGNELGMGSLPYDVVARAVPNGGSLWCTVPSDFPVVCGISNWGAAALLAGVAMLRPDIGRAALDYLHPAMAWRLLDAVYGCGAVAAGANGAIPAPRPFVDGQPWPILEHTHQQIYELCRQTLEFRSGK